MQLLSEFTIFVFGYVFVLTYSITTVCLEHDWSLLYYSIMYRTPPNKIYYLRI